MVAVGSTRIVLERDGWTVRTADRSLSAHEEHTIMVSEGGPVVLTAAGGALRSVIGVRVALGTLRGETKGAGEGLREDRSRHDRRALVSE
jgi:hypothetical protein